MASGAPLDIQKEFRVQSSVQGRKRGEDSEELLSHLLKELTTFNFKNVRNLMIRTLMRTSSLSTLKYFVSLMLEKVVSEPNAVHPIGRLCFDLIRILPPFPADVPCERDSSFKRVLIDRCQMEFERTVTEIENGDTFDAGIERRLVAVVRFLGELFKRGILTVKICYLIIWALLTDVTGETFARESKVEAICEFLISVGQRLDSDNRLQDYITTLEKLSANLMLPLRSRLKILNLVELRSKNWVPKHEETEVLEGKYEEELNSWMQREADLKNKLKEMEKLLEMCKKESDNLEVEHAVFKLKYTLYLFLAMFLWIGLVLFSKPN